MAKKFLRKKKDNINIYDLGGNLSTDGIQVTDQVNMGNNIERFKMKKTYDTVLPIVNSIMGIAGGALNSFLPGAGSAMQGVTDTATSLMNSKLYGMGGKMMYPNGGELPTQDEIKAWNDYLIYFNNKIATDKVNAETLDQGPNDYDLKVFNEYKQNNPNFTYDHDPFVAKMQTYFNDLYNDPRMQKENSNWYGAYKQPGLSKVDSRIGSYTSNYYIPRGISDVKKSGDIVQENSYIYNPYDQTNIRYIDNKNLTPEQIDQYGNVPVKKRFGGRISKYDMGGQLTEINGPNHDMGGVSISPETEVEGNETINNQYVFSDRLFKKSKSGKKISFAKASKNINNKFKLRDDKLTQEAKQMELDELANEQEMARESIMTKAHKKAYGGIIDPPKKPNDASDIYNLENLPWDITTDPGYIPENNITIPTLTNESNFVTPELSPDSTSVPTTLEKSSNIINPIEGTNTSTTLETTENNQNKLNPFGYISAGITNLGKGIANVLQDNPTSTPNVYFDRLSKDPVIRNRILANRSKAGTNRIIGSTGTTSGQVLSNLGAYNANTDASLAASTGALENDINNSNTQIQMREAMANNQITTANNLMNEQFKDNKLNNWMQVLDNNNTLGQQVVSDDSRNKVQNSMIDNWLNTQNYQIIDNKPTFVGKNEKGETVYRDVNTGEVYTPKSKRILIKKKKN